MEETKARLSKLVGAQELLQEVEKLQEDRQLLYIDIHSKFDRNQLVTRLQAIFERNRLNFKEVYQKTEKYRAYVSYRRFAHWMRGLHKLPNDEPAVRFMVEMYNNVATSPDLPRLAVEPSRAVLVGDLQEKINPEQFDRHKATTNEASTTWCNKCRCYHSRKADHINTSKDLDNQKAEAKRLLTSALHFEPTSLQIEQFCYGVAIDLLRAGRTLGAK